VVRGLLGRRTMPSVLHEVLVELFRNRGELGPELLRICADIKLDHDHVEHASIDLSQVVSTEYRADAVVELRDRDDGVIAAVIVEVQLGVDADKRDTWPLYITALRAKLKRPVVLLVVTAERAVTRWARTKIAIGHPGFDLTPIVVSFEDVPRSIDPVSAQRLPELAVLSAMAHPELEMATAAIEAISQLPEDQNRLYLDVVMTLLPARIRQILEARMLQGYKYQSEFALRYYNQGHEKGREEGRNEGREEGRNEGREEGRNEGREEGMRLAVLALAQSRLAAVTDEDHAVIETIRDERGLTELINALARASSSSEARTALALVISRLRNG
jgi:hypothetical protein